MLRQMAVFFCHVSQTHNAGGSRKKMKTATLIQYESSVEVVDEGTMTMITEILGCSRSG